MKALITGASSGIGRDIAIELSRRGCELILVARREDRLKQLADSLDVKCEIFVCDVSKREECFRLYERFADKGIDILVNNAGFGLFGEFTETDLDRELEMVDVNVTAVHILTKLFLREFCAKNSGRILNVASIAGFMPGPLMSTYYATKAYVVRLTQSIIGEISEDFKGVYVGALCPGPVDTEFNENANVKFGLSSMKSSEVARIAVKKMLCGKRIIFPNLGVKIAVYGGRLLPDALLARLAKGQQERKRRS